MTLDKWLFELKQEPSQRVKNKQVDVVRALFEVLPKSIRHYRHFINGELQEDYVDQIKKRDAQLLGLSEEQ